MSDMILPLFVIICHMNKWEIRIETFFEFAYYVS